MGMNSLFFFYDVLLLVGNCGFGSVVWLILFVYYVKVYKIV